MGRESVIVLPKPVAPKAWTPPDQDSSADRVALCYFQAMCEIGRLCRNTGASNEVNRIAAVDDLREIRRIVEGVLGLEFEEKT